MRCTILTIISIICFKFNSAESFTEDISTPGETDKVIIPENVEETVKKVATENPEQNHLENKVETVKATTTEKPLEPTKNHIPENEVLETVEQTTAKRPSKPEIDSVEKKYIAKCCPIGKYVHDKSCVLPKVFKNFTFDITVPLYDVYQRRTGKHLPDVYNLVPGRFDDRTFTNYANDYHRGGHNYYLTENGTLYEEVPNELKRWHEVSPDSYCVDFLVRRGLKPELRFWTIIQTHTRSPDHPFLKYGLLISCVFLLAVLVVYYLLPELRNLTGLIQMAYVVSLIGAFLLLAVMQMDQYSTFTCLGLTYSIYFFFLATFCWINVMSWDINSTFSRSHSNNRWRHSRWSKFYIYCAYAFGLPSAMTIMLIVLNNTDMRYLPWFVTPNLAPKRGCFFGEDEKLLYLYIPMMILILFNFAMYIMTCNHLCRQYKKTAFLDSAMASSAATHRTQRKKFMIFVKLFSIMGLNWSLEVISSFFPGLYIWYISDLYNMLVGFFVFLITVGTQKSTRNKLIKRIQRRSEWSHFRFSRSRTSNSTSSTNETDVTQETPLRRPSVCGNPSGPS